MNPSDDIDLSKRYPTRIELQTDGQNVSYVLNELVLENMMNANIFGSQIVVSEATLKDIEARMYKTTGFEKVQLDTYHIPDKTELALASSLYEKYELDEYFSIAIVVCSGLYITFKRDFDQFNPFYKEAYVYAVINKPAETEGENEWTRYRYNLTGYTTQGEKTQITFSSSEEQEQDAYVKVLAKGAYTKRRDSRKRIEVNSMNSNSLKHACTVFQIDSLEVGY